jgi:pilus assembly protein Flp/PilA
MWIRLNTYLLSKFREKEGQGMVEYALLLGLVALVVVGSLALIGPQLRDRFQEYAELLKL